MITDTIKKFNELNKDEIKDILEQPYPKFHVTEKTKNDVLNNPNKYTDCDARVRKGKFYTDEEFQSYIKESLKRTLPSKEKQLVLKKHKN